MSQERTIQNLLWALSELGVKYSPSNKVFNVFNGVGDLTNCTTHDDAVRAAQHKLGYIRMLEVQNSVTFPTTAEEFVQHVTTNLLPELKPSNLHNWKKEFKETLDEFLFDIRKVNG